MPRPMRAPRRRRRQVMPMDQHAGLRAPRVLRDEVRGPRREASALREAVVDAAGHRHVEDLYSQVRRVTSIGPNPDIQSQFGAPHRVTSPPRAHDLAYSSCGEPSAGVDASARRRSAARVVVMVVASTADKRRAGRIASINTHCGGSGQEQFCTISQGPHASRIVVLHRSIVQLKYRKRVALR